MRKFIFGPKYIKPEIKTGAKYFCNILKASFYEDVVQLLIMFTACDSEESPKIDLILEEIPDDSEVLKKIAQYMYPGNHSGIIVLDPEKCTRFSWYGQIKCCGGKAKIDWDNIEVCETPEAYKKRRIAQKFGLLA